MAADLMKLIAYGKVMDDNSKTLKDYSIKDGDFLVVMVSKPKPAPKQNEGAVQQQPPVQENQSQPPVQQPPAGQPVQEQPNLPPQSEEAINELISISGKTRDQCI
mmetsp:Transcript_8311/g.7705  ORF Transcript_8311/g.7705 Transcript_8311/m.7705 type:complete len:105 (+) Transcript_8311:141-455(+)